MKLHTWFPPSPPPGDKGTQARVSRPHREIGCTQGLSRTAAFILLSSKRPEALKLFTRQDISAVRKQEDPEVECCHAGSWASQKSYSLYLGKPPL